MFDISASIMDKLYTVLLAIDMFFCQILDILYSMFEVFSGMTTVQYTGDDKVVTHDALINIFFSNPTINKIYWGMAAIGIVLCLFFTLSATVRKMFDIDEKVKSSMGGILRNLLTSIVIIFALQFVMFFVLNLTNVLMQSIGKLFDDSQMYVAPTKIEFNENQYATMARVLNTIGNYSVNPSRESKYNINACYNDIRSDMRKLQQEDVFDYSYQQWELVKNDEDNTTKVVYKDSDPTWQSALVKIARSHDLSKEQDIDKYDEGLAKAILECMEAMETGQFKPLKSYELAANKMTYNETPFGSIVFLSGTMSAAKDDRYNKNVGLFDELRYDYVRQGGKSIYSFSDVKGDFDISWTAFNHLLIIIIALLIGNNFLALCVDCVGRIFNMLLLYLVAPPFIAITPLDEGEKMKQWITAFIVQAFGVIATIISIRIVILIVPIVFNGNLVLFDESHTIFGFLDGSVLDFFAKIVILVSMSYAMKQASKMVTGILANSAGYQSIQAGDIGAAGAATIMSGLSHTPFGAIGHAATESLKNSPVGTFFNWRDDKKNGNGGNGGAGPVQPAGGGGESESDNEDLGTNMGGDAHEPDEELTPESGPGALSDDAGGENMGATADSAPGGASSDNDAGGENMGATADSTSGGENMGATADSAPGGASTNNDADGENMGGEGHEPDAEIMPEGGSDASNNDVDGENMGGEGHEPDAEIMPEGGSAVPDDGAKNTENMGTSSSSAAGGSQLRSERHKQNAARQRAVRQLRRARRNR